jgi:hypothetical protein
VTASSSFTDVVDKRRALSPRFGLLHGLTTEEDSQSSHASAQPNSFGRRGGDRPSSPYNFVPRAFDAIDEHIVWHNGGRSRFSHDANGIDETLGFFMELVQASEGTFHLDIHDIVANDDHAVALVTSHQEVGGVKYEDLGSHVVHMKDGKVTESWFFAWNPYQQDELFPA